ncbi:hypothetical protein Golomagni_03200 [Golovinomyces magnicellulatus]|nr:hypothetical protein Golomagni_03200 [Golovinomyces magnicellulatus]
MTPCREVPACVLACNKPASDLPSFINDLRNSIITKEISSTTPESYYTGQANTNRNTHEGFPIDGK